MRKLLILSALLIASTIYAQQQYTFVFLNKKPDAAQITKEESAKIMDGHMANINRLAKEGKLLAAGPFDGGGGLFILNTQNIDEASDWLSTDPGVQAKRWNIELLSYKPRVGGVCPVGETYEMTSYSFIRFIPVATKLISLNYADILKQHEDYLKHFDTGANVVTEATFGEKEGGILILKGEVKPDAFKDDPGIRDGFLTTGVKKLFIAKGSFCEK